MEKYSPCFKAVLTALLIVTAIEGKAIGDAGRKEKAIQFFDDGTVYEEYKYDPFAAQAQSRSDVLGPTPLQMAEDRGDFYTDPMMMDAWLNPEDKAIKTLSILSSIFISLAMLSLLDFAIGQPLLTLGRQLFNIPAPSTPPPLLAAMPSLTALIGNLTTGLDSTALAPQVSMTVNETLPLLPTDRPGIEISLPMAPGIEIGPELAQLISNVQETISNFSDAYGQGLGIEVSKPSWIEALFGGGESTTNTPVPQTETTTSGSWFDWLFGGEDEETTAAPETTVATPSTTPKQVDQASIVSSLNVKGPLATLLLSLQKPATDAPQSTPSNFVNLVGPSDAAVDAALTPQATTEQPVNLQVNLEPVTTPDLQLQQGPSGNPGLQQGTDNLVVNLNSPTTAPGTDIVVNLPNAQQGSGPEIVLTNPGQLDIKLEQQPLNILPTGVPPDSDVATGVDNLTILPPNVPKLPDFLEVVKNPQAAGNFISNLINQEGVTSNEVVKTISALLGQDALEAAKDMDKADNNADDPVRKAWYPLAKNLLEALRPSSQSD